MRTTLVLVAVFCLLAGSQAKAGVYLTEEPKPVWPLPASLRDYNNNHLREWQGILTDDPIAEARMAVAVLGQLFHPTIPPWSAGKQIGIVGDSIQRKMSALVWTIRPRVAHLKQRKTQGVLTLDDRINLSAYLILQARYNEAIEVLTPALNEQPRNFMVLANLAAANQGAGLATRAISYQQQALSHWPRMYPGWTSTQLDWYRRCEKYQLQIYTDRYRERLANKPQNTLDSLFPGVKFDDPMADYQAGEIPRSMRDALPADALDVVRQLLLWWPHDTRLIWLYGELLNAHGEVVAAAEVLDNVVYARNFRNRVAQRHWSLLMDAKQWAALKPDNRRKLLMSIRKLDADTGDFLKAVWPLLALARSEGQPMDALVQAAWAETASAERLWVSRQEVALGWVETFRLTVGVSPLSAVGNAGTLLLDPTMIHNVDFNNIPTGPPRITTGPSPGETGDKNPPANSDQDAKSLGMNWRHITIVFVSGLLLGGLAVFQLRLLARRLFTSRAQKPTTAPTAR